VTPTAKNSIYINYLDIIWIAFFLLFWISPQAVLAIDPDATTFIESLWVYEFIFGHATVAFSIAFMLKNNVKRTIVSLFFFLFYGVFFVALFMTGAVLPVILFLFSIIGRFLKTFQNNSKEERGNELIFQLGMAFTRVMVLLIAAVPAMFPWPQLGIDPSIVQFSGEGEFVDHPEKIVIWMISFYSLMLYIENILVPKVKERIKKSTIQINSDL